MSTPPDGTVVFEYPPDDAEAKTAPTCETCGALGVIVSKALTPDRDALRNVRCARHEHGAWWWCQTKLRFCQQG